MSGVELIEKTCTKCKATKPLSEFHRNRRSKDGHHHWCKPCLIENAKRSNERLREEMGEVAYLRHKSRIVRQHRARTGNARGKALNAARQAAISKLIDQHRKEFDALLTLEKYERGLS